MREQRGERPEERAAISSGRVARAAFAAAIVFSIALCSLSASAQTASAPAAPEPSPADREAAGEAYDRGTAAYLAHDYPRAASLFETAYRLAPNSAALIQAVRAHDRAGDHLRAASLALRLQARHAGDRQAERQAETTLRTAAPQFLRVEVTCDAACSVELDGRIEDHTAFFVDPASPHAVRASFDTGTSEAQTTTGAEGQTQAMSFARPAAAPVADVVVAVVDPDPGPEEPIAPPPPPSSGGISPAVFVTALALTAVAGGVLIWSGVDTLDGLPAYRDEPTVARLQDGQGRELRTNVMIGVTGALAITTVVLAIVTDWDGDPASSDSPTVGAAVSPEGGAVSVQGRF